MKVGILPWEKYEGRENIGSSRIRAKWVAAHWDDAEIFKQGAKYDVVIYQKCYWVEHAKLFKGIKILDLCDPDWLHWGYRIVEMIEEVDAITTSTEALAESVRKFTKKPVKCIPDRLDLDNFKQKKVHVGEAKEVVWYGYSQNYELLQPVIHFLIKNNLDLIVISDKQFQLQTNHDGKLNVTFYKWSNETVNNDILKGDIVVNPKTLSGRWQYKSNNKTIQAWALGMPVATTVEELIKFKDENERIIEANKRLQEVKEKWDVRLSVEEYIQLIQSIKKN